MNTDTLIRFLTITEVIVMHAVQVDQFGGSHGIRDIGLLDSALHAPCSMYADVYLHEDIFHMAAAYMFHLIKNHPFIDGNKRIGMVVGLVFLKINGVALSLTNDQVFALAIDIATSKISKDEITILLRTYQKHS